MKKREEFAWFRGFHPYDSALDSGHRFHAVFALFTLVIAISSVTRIVLAIGTANSLDWHPLGLLGVFAVGLGYDIISASYLSIPLVIYLVFVPDRLLHSRFHGRWSRLWLVAGTYGLLILAFAEWTFWAEFQVRFNFIAVDYLVYTTEVLDNIRESYPIGSILVLLLVPTIVIVAAWIRLASRHPTGIRHTPFVKRFAIGSALLVIPLVATASVNSRMCPGFGDRFAQELARNGIYSFFAAFRDNELDYEGF